MKKKLLIPLFCLCLFFMTSCGKNETVSDNADNATLPAQAESTPNNKDTAESKNSTEDETTKQTDFKELKETVSTDVDSTISAMKATYEEMIIDIDTYEKYLENTDKVETFYRQICEDTKQLCIRMREYGVGYAETIMASDKSNDDKYTDFEKLYDCIYDDAGDDIYDEIYDGILDDIYDDFYDGILDDAYDNGVPYNEWADARSDEYDWWSDARSDVYDEWSDFRSDIYDFWSDMRSELWDDDIERAEEKIVDFQEDIEKLKSKDSQNNAQTSNGEKSNTTTSEDTENKEVDTNVELVDGMRPEFKEAMDSYEAFYDEYCDIMNKYAENPSDIELLTSYANILTKAAEMSEKFEAWKDNEINDVELKYYLDVNNRVTKKLLDLPK